MGLIVGSTNAGSGMSQAIFQEMDDQLSPPLQKAVDEAPDDTVKKGAQTALDEARNSWRKLSYAIAKGVVDHITANMEIVGIETQGDVNTSVQGATGSADPARHLHTVNLTGEENDVIFVQSNDGTGHVR